MPHVTIYMSPEDDQRQLRIKMKTGFSASFEKIIRNALRIYDWYLDTVNSGHKIHLERPDGTFIKIELTLDGPRGSASGEETEKFNRAEIVEMLEEEEDVGSDSDSGVFEIPATV